MNEEEHYAPLAPGAQSFEDYQRLLACYIHDGLCQYLAAGIGYLNAYQDLRSESPDQADEWLDLGMQVLDHAMEEARQLVGRLRGSPADGPGLVDAVHRLIGESHWSNRLTVRFDHHVAEGALAPNEQDAAFRIIQESLNNAARHSQSEEARVRATVDCGVLRILVEDDGVGFDPWQVSGDHYGIEGMRLRASLLGGWLTVDSFAGHGTQVTAEIPLKKLES